MGQQIRYPRYESYVSLPRKGKKSFFVLTLVYKVTERTNEHTEDILQLQSLEKHKQNTEITRVTENAESQLQMLAEI